LGDVIYTVLVAAHQMELELTEEKIRRPSGTQQAEAR